MKRFFFKVNVGHHVFRCHAIEGCLVEPDVERKVKSAWVGVSGGGWGFLVGGGGSRTTVIRGPVLYQFA